MSVDELKEKAKPLAYGGKRMAEMGLPTKDELGPEDKSALFRELINSSYNARDEQRKLSTMSDVEIKRRAMAPLYEHLDDVALELLNIALHGKTESSKLKAISMYLDRVIGRPAEDKSDRSRGAVIDAVAIDISDENADGVRELIEKATKGR